MLKLINKLKVNFRKKIKIIFDKLTINSSNIFVFWSSNKFLAGENWDNFGDALAPYLITKITGKKVVWCNNTSKSKRFFKKRIYLTIGSILEYSDKNNIIWGSGIMNSNAILKKAKYILVRGPISYSRVIASGYKMKKVWGDPALLLPFYYPVPKKNKRDIFTIIPHYIDYDDVKSRFSKVEGVEIVDLKNSKVEEIINQIATSKFVFSSSLHGLIVSHSYGVNAIWVTFSDKLCGDDIKFYDYLMSVNIKLYKPFVFDEELINNKFDYTILGPDAKDLQKIQLNLLDTCPFI